MLERAAGRAVDHVDALLLQHPRQTHALLRPPARVVLAGKPHEQRLLGRPHRAHVLGDLDREPHAVHLVAAVRVGALVGDRRQELMDQIAVGAVDLENVEAGLVGAHRRLAPLADHVAHLVVRERARHRRIVVVRDRARRDELPAVPVVDLGLVAFERLAAFPRPRQPRLAAGVAELDGGDRALLLDEGRRSARNRE